MVKNYNETVHSSTKMTPTEASKEKNENKVWLNLYSLLKVGKEPKYSVGDKVRIAKKKTTFEKDTHRDGLKMCLPSTKFFVQTHPPTY